MRELICLNIGQAGVQISNAIWELFCTEHGINCHGNLVSDSQLEDFYSCHTIFHEIDGFRYVPRTLSVDMEPTVIDEIRTGSYRNLFGSYQLVSGLEDSSCNFARGHYTIGKTHLEECLNVLRHLASQCDSLQSLIFIQSFGGGCGSGFTSLLMEHVHIEYAKVSRIMSSILPSKDFNSSIVEPYNYIVASKFCIDSTDLCFSQDNDMLFHVITKNLEVRSPTLTNINRLIAQIFSSITVSVRYENSLKNNLDQLAVNLVPYPRLHYLISAYSPIQSPNKGRLYSSSVQQITQDVFIPNSFLLNCESTLEDRFISCCLQYRGNINPVEINLAIMKVKLNESVKFVNWCPTGFKIGINKRPPVAPKNSSLHSNDKSVLLLSNNTCFNNKLTGLSRKFDKLFKKRSFVHWFIGEGMEEGEFVEAREEIGFLIEDYKCLVTEEEEAEDEEANITKENSDEKHVKIVLNDDLKEDEDASVNAQPMEDENVPMEILDENNPDENISIHNEGTPSSIQTEEIPIHHSTQPIYSEPKDMERKLSKNKDSRSPDLGSKEPIEVSEEQTKVIEKTSIKNDKDQINTQRTEEEITMTSTMNPKSPSESSNNEVKKSTRRKSNKSIKSEKSELSDYNNLKKLIDDDSDSGSDSIVTL